MRLLFCATLSLLFSFFIIGCQKEIAPITSTTPTSTDSTTTDTTSAGNNGSASGSYQSLTAGTWWKYKDSTTGTSTTVTVGSATKTVNTILFHEITADNNATPEWMAVQDYNYYIYGTGVSPSGGTYDLLFNYLNDSASVGYSWKYNAGSGNGFTAYITTTILAKNISVTVSGKTYSNVIETKLEQTYDLGGNVMAMGNYHYFIAKGIGIIKIQSDFSLLGAAVGSTSSDLIDYNIK